MNGLINILFAGDFASNGRCEELLYNKKFEKLLGNVKNEITAADYSIVNLESPIIKPSFKPIKKVGPSIKAPSEIADAIKYVGFNMVSLANNHMNDYDADGILYTMRNCYDRDIETIGAGKNLMEASETVYKIVEGKTFAFINCCEHEFSITDKDTPGCNPLNPIDQYNSIKKAKNKADFIIVMVHGGIEMYQLPTPRMQKTYRFFVDAGADVVINHHQHCFSGYEKYGNGLIVYGLGNFCFDWPSRENCIWNEGYLAKVTFSNSGLALQLIPYTQGLDNVGVQLMGERSKSKFNRKIDELNSIIADSEKLQLEYNKFLINTDNEFRAILSTYSSRITTALCRRGLLPVFNGDYQLRRILLNISCESHLERLQHYIKTHLK